ncbi:MAG: hypothetical protein K0Q79_1129 [Flavipsychrobacter sp.]|nr:hypothetical protein [Flavipsychrobacter sp.]
MSQVSKIKWIDAAIIYYALLALVDILLVFLVGDGRISYVTVTWSVAMLAPLIFRHNLIYLLFGAVLTLASAYFLFVISLNIMLKGNPNGFNTTGTLGAELLFILAFVFAIVIFYTGCERTIKKRRSRLRNATVQGLI